MTAYLVTTPKNPTYEGKVFGIQFSNGRAVVSKETLSPHLGYTVEQVVQGMKDFGYEVKPMAAEVAPVRAEPVAEKPKRNASRRRKGAEVTEPALSQ
jgi:hypothetical protein